MKHFLALMTFLCLCNRPLMASTELRQFVQEAALTDGSLLEITIVDNASEEQRANTTIDRALAAIRKLDQDFGAAPAAATGNLHDQLNHLKPHTPLKLPEGYFLLFEQAIELAKLTNGWFDITAPSKKGIFVQRDYRRVELRPASSEMVLTKKHLKFDLRWLLSGTACDAALAIIQEAGFQRAEVKVGPVSKHIGRDIHTPWGLQIDIPGVQDAYAHRAFQYRLSDIAVAQLIPEKITPPLIDPKTKNPVKGQVKSITVMAKDALHAIAFAVAIAPFDALTGIRYLEKFPGLEGIIVDQTGALFISEGKTK